MKKEETKLTYFVSPFLENEFYQVIYFRMDISAFFSNLETCA